MGMSVCVRVEFAGESCEGKEERGRDVRETSIFPSTSQAGEEGRTALADAHKRRERESEGVCERERERMRGTDFILSLLSPSIERNSLSADEAESLWPDWQNQ